MSMQAFEGLLGQYWDLAYIEGKTGVSQGDKANEVLHKLREALAEQPEPVQQEPSDLDMWKARALQAESVIEKFMTPQPAQQERCHLCDCTGDIHSADGEWRGECPYCKPVQRKPDHNEFMKWAGNEGYDTAHTINSDNGKFIALNPMTADLWKAWQAAHGIKE